MCSRNPVGATYLLDFPLDMVEIDLEDEALDDFGSIDLDDFPVFFVFDDLENDVCSKDTMGIFDDFVEMDTFTDVDGLRILSPPDDSPYEKYGTTEDKGSFIKQPPRAKGAQ